MSSITTQYTFTKIISSSKTSTTNFTNYITSNFDFIDIKKIFNYILDISGNFTTQIQIYTTISLTDTNLFSLTKLITNYITDYEFRNITNIKYVSIYSFTRYISKNFDLTDKINIPQFIYDTGIIPLGIVIHTIAPVPNSRITELNNYVANYTDPIYTFPGLIRKISMASSSTIDIDSSNIFECDTSTMSDCCKTMSSFILPYNMGACFKIVINQINLTFDISTYDITLFSYELNDSFTVELYNYTTSTSIIIGVYFINDIITSWKNKAASGIKGYILDSKIISIMNLYGKMPDYDCFIKINMIPSNKNIQLFLSDVHYLYYPHSAVVPVPTPVV